jgi:ATP-binding cassette, subfamily B, bacterial CvaB/MchF/RaxB
MSRLAELNLARRRRLPVVLAAEAAECGLACLTMVARFHGHDIDLNGLRQRFALSLSGASLGSLMRLADSLALSGRALRVELEMLEKVRLPAILHWDLNHFVVLAGVAGKRVTIHDPAFGKRELWVDEVSKHFTGVVLELSPSAEFVPVVARTPMRLRLFWSKLSGGGSAFAQVMLLSLTLQIDANSMPTEKPSPRRIIRAARKITITVCRPVMVFCRNKAIRSSSSSHAASLGLYVR